MAGSPLKRQRKLGIRAEDGSIIAFPRMPRGQAFGVDAGVAGGLRDRH